MGSNPISSIRFKQLLKLLKDLQNIKEETEIRSKILEAGITIRIIDSKEKEELEVE